MTCRLFIRGVDTSMMMFDGSGGAKENEFSADAVLYDEDLKELLVSDVEEMISSDGSSIVVAELDMDGCDEEFLEFLNEWTSFHDKIHGLVGKYGEDWVWEHEPMKELFMSYVGSDSKEHVCTLGGVMYMDKMSDGKILFFVASYKEDKVA